ncbi:MAG: substrate-binding domain-containing protein [Cyclobacteriaceae bacterium]
MITSKRIVRLGLFGTLALFALTSTCQKIGFAMDDFDYVRWVEDSSTFYQQATKLGAEVLITSCDSDPSLHLQQVKKMVEQEEVQCLVIVASDKMKNGEILDYAASKNVPTILYDRVVFGSADYYISFDSEEIGEQMATYIIENTEPGANVVLFNGPSSDYNSTLIKKGVMNILAPYLEAQRVNLIYDHTLAYWTTMEGFQAMSNLLVDNTKKIDAIICPSDRISAGVIEALDMFPNLKQPIIVGQDGGPVSREFIKQGKQHFSVNKPSNDLAKMTAEVAVAIANGKGSPYVAEKIKIAGIDYNYIQMQAIPITKESLR